jgi:hypothetical protein
MAASTASSTRQYNPADYLHDYPHLSVIELENNDAIRRKIIDVTKAWTQEADKKFDMGQKGSDLSVIFYTLSNIACGIRNYMRNVDWHGRIFVCTDKKSHTIQAIACTRLQTKENDALEIVYLLTNPYNVRSTLNKNAPNCVKGAGSAIINYLVKRFLLQSSCPSIELLAAKEAVGFYEKLGFVTREILWTFDQQMSLSATRAIEILFPKAA